MINIWVHGASGRTGKLVVEQAEKSADIQITGASSRAVICPEKLKGKPLTDSDVLKQILSADVIIDFSTPEASLNLIKSCSRAGFTGGYLLATTGFDDKALSEIKTNASKFSLLRAGNTSIGVFMLGRIAKTLAKVFSPLGYDIEITESHHRMKVDAPSGTALFLADQIISADKSLKPVTNHDGGRKENTIGIHSLRGGQVFGEHTIRFLGDLEELSISHKALSRDLFAKGALVLANWVTKKSAGFYEFSDIDPNEFS